VSELTDRIRAKGHWDVVIRPEPFLERRVDYASLDDIVNKAAVRLRGWPVPYVEYREPPIRGDDWIGQDIDAGVVAQYEAWRFFMSGQFNHLRAVSADWRTGSEATAVPEGFASVIEVWEILFYITEVFELAARLALGPAGDEQMAVDITLNGLEERGLVVGQRRRAPFVQPYRAGTGRIHQTVTLSRESLVSSARQHAVDMAREFFVRFGWKASVGQLASHQQELDRL
jgi:hypothetical protein